MKDEKLSDHLNKYRETTCIWQTNFVIWKKSVFIYDKNCQQSDYESFVLQ